MGLPGPPVRFPSPAPAGEAFLQLFRLVSDPLLIERRLVPGLDGIVLVVSNPLVVAPATAISLEQLPLALEPALQSFLVKDRFDRIESALHHRRLDAWKPEFFARLAFTLRALSKPDQLPAKQLVKSGLAILFLPGIPGLFCPKAGLVNVDQAFYPAARVGPVNVFQDGHTMLGEALVLHFKAHHGQLLHDVAEFGGRILKPDEPTQLGDGRLQVAQPAGV